MSMREIAKVIPLNSCVVGEGIHRHAITGPAGFQMSMRHNELLRLTIIAAIFGEFIPAHPDGDVLADFEMQVGIIKSMRCSHRSHLLSTRDGLAAVHEDLIKMPVQ